MDTFTIGAATVTRIEESYEPNFDATMFFKDPSGNALEFKAFADRTKLFAK